MISLSHVCKSYGRTEVLRDVSLSLAGQTITGLLGPNGAGKTTLVHILMGVLAWDEGDIRVDGLDLRGNRSEVLARCSLVPQTLSFYPSLTTRENLEYFGALAGWKGRTLRRRMEACIAAGRLEDVVYRRADRCSGGMQRRLNLAIGLLNDPRILYLDEPTVGVDVETRSGLLEIIRHLHRDEGKTVVYTSHYLEEIEQIAQEIVILHEGRIVLQGAKERLLREKGGVRLRLDPFPGDVRREAARIPAVRCDADGITVVAGESLTEDLAALATLIAQRGARIVAVDPGAGRLEALFVRLTERDGNGK